MSEVRPLPTQPFLFYMFNKGELVTLVVFKIGDKIPKDSIYEIVNSKPASSSVKRLSTGKLEKVARLNTALRKLSPTEIVLYG
jgi:hypothetical protein